MFMPVTDPAISLDASDCNHEEAKRHHREISTRWPLWWRRSAWRRRRLTRRRVNMSETVHTSEAGVRVAVLG